MEGILTQRTPARRLIVSRRDNNCGKQVAFKPSPSNQYGIGINQLLSRNVLSAQEQRSIPSSVSAQSSARNAEKSANLLTSVNLNIPMQERSHKREEKPKKAVKMEPKISSTPLLPSVFTNEKSSALKMKKLIKKQLLGNLDNISSTKEGISLDAANGSNLNSERRFLQSFLSPQRNVSSVASPRKVSLVNQIQTNCSPKQDQFFKRPSLTRESVRKIEFENVEALKNEDSACNDGNNSNAAVKKQIIIFKKCLSKSPENKISILQNTDFTSVMNLVDRLPAPLPKAKTKISLNEMITLRKIKSTQSGGIIKRMLHVPSLNVFDVQEEPIKANQFFKDFINCWKNSFNSKENKCVQKIFTCFWNAPEGRVSIVKEPLAKGNLQELLDYRISIPESCIRELTISIIIGISDVYRLLNQPYQMLALTEILFDAQGHPKLSFGISSKFESPQFESADYIKEGDHQEGASKVNNSSADSERNNLNHLHYSDIFDLGYLLLTCALGNLELFDTSGFYNRETLKALAEVTLSHQNQSKNLCCILHCEEELRKFYCEFSPTIKLRESGHKNPFVNNYQLNSPKSQPSNSEGSNTKTSYPFTLLELLKRHNRFSNSFMDFLCQCLQINPTSRSAVSSLLEHQFVSAIQASSGPLINLSELFSLEKNVEDVNLNEERINKVFEAIKIVLINQEIKQKMIELLRDNVLNNQNSPEYRKIIYLASELGVRVEFLVNKIRSDIFATELNH